jgi:hypothetical protein
MVSEGEARGLGTRGHSGDLCELREGLGDAIGARRGLQGEIWHSCDKILQKVTYWMHTVLFFSFF